MENGEKGTIKLNIMENVDKAKILIDKRARIFQSPTKNLAGIHWMNLKK